jgi:Fe-S-cluster-containing dehydrogenase component
MAVANLPVRWLKILDQTRCIGCHACTTACKSENEVPLGVTRTYVKSADVGVFPQVRRVFQVTRCNQCSNAPCTAACPTRAMYRRTDGIVDFDKSVCVGCKACIAACPYDAIFINPYDHSAEKCNLCAHRLEVGLEPACVVVCPTGAILVGDGNDSDSAVARIVAQEPVQVRRPEKETRPGVYYRGGHQATLDPLAARRPDGGLFAWATQGQPTPALVTSGHPGRPTSTRTAVLSYDVPHYAPWGWRVSLYTWTKAISAGAFGVPVVLALVGRLSWDNAAVRWAAPTMALALLAITGILLIADLKHPLRFYLIFTRHQWRSWLVRGAVIIGGYGVVLTLYVVAGLVSLTGHAEPGGIVGLAEPASWLAARQALAWVGLPLALAAAVYTAYLLGQARGRDLWHSRLLAPHLAVQAVLAGAAAMLPVLGWLSPGRAVSSVEVTLTIAAAADVALAAFEIIAPGANAHARLAVAEMIRGRWARFYWPGLVLVVAAIAAPWLGVAAAPIALAGLFAHEHAYIQAGQSVPLA